MQKYDTEFDMEEDEAPPLEIMPDDSVFEKYPIKEASQDMTGDDGLDIMNGETEDLFSLKEIVVPIEDDEPLQKDRPAVKSSVLIKIGAVFTALILLIALAWFEVGIIYTENLNKKLYEEFLSGKDIKTVNEDFLFFLKVEGTDIILPVAESDTPHRFTTFDSRFFYPGSATAKIRGNHTVITGPVNSLWDISENDLVGKKIILASPDGNSEYTITHSHTCTEGFEDVSLDIESITVYIKNSGIHAVHAKKAN